MTIDKVLRKIIHEACGEEGVQILSERPKGRWTESDVTLRSGKSAKFGSAQHIKDLERLISDLDRVRSRQSSGSASRAHISSAISAVRKELRSAQKKYNQARPVETLEEKD